MKLTTMTQVTVDGVMQGNGGATDEDRRNGFERGGWAMGTGDDQTMTFINETYERADAFLFGRRTYELFAELLGRGGDGSRRGGGSGQQPDRRRPEHEAQVPGVDHAQASRAGRTRPSSSVTSAAAIRELKAERAGELQVHGSATLVRCLLEHDLVDEIILLIVPVVLGQGARLFADAGPDIALDLVDSRTDSKGVTIQVYRPNGRPHYAD